jgi:hypothetical protein
VPASVAKGQNFCQSQTAAEVAVISRQYQVYRVRKSIATLQKAHPGRKKAYQAGTG